MASVICDPNGLKRIQFAGADGRKTIRLGKVTQKNADSFKSYVEQILAAQITGHALDQKAAAWVAALDDKMTKRLAAVGLVAPRVSMTLGEFLTAYQAERTDIKPYTKANHAQAVRNLLGCFGAGKALRSFSTDATDGDKFRAYLVDESLGENTIRKRCQIAKLFFKAAKRRKLVDGNPFLELVGSVRSDRDKFHFVTPEEAGKVLEKCPHNEWRLIFALSRYGGLRCPSEHLALRWNDILWDQKKMMVRAPKTEHHEGHEVRAVPLFPELLPYLDKAWAEAPDGAEFVLSKSRDVGVNWRTHLLRIINRAGLEPWPRLFHNLRATRQTELTNKYPQHVVCKWMGNSQSVAQEHYLHVTDEHFASATSEPEKAAQKAAQYTAVMPRNAQETKTGITRIPEENETLLSVTNDKCSLMDSNTTGNRRKNRDSCEHAAQKAAQLPPDDELARVVAAWPTLPAALRRRVVRLVETGR